MTNSVSALEQTIELPVAGSWVVDPTHSSVGFVARHLMFAKVNGRFKNFEALIDIKDVPEDSRVEVSIEAASIDTGEPKRDAHLTSPDFLDVEKFPSLKFSSSALRRTGESTFEIFGDLTIRDVTRPVILDAEYVGLAKDPWGSERSFFSATTEIDREDWGITWNQALEAGGVLVGKQVKIEIEVEVEAVRKD